MSCNGSVDLVLVNPSSRKKVYQSLGKELSAIEPPVWAGLMATFVRNHGYRVAIVDAEAEELTAAQTADRVLSLKPQLTAVVVYGHQPSASTQIMPAAGAVTSILKDRAPDHKVLLVGGHVAALPEQTLREEAADFVSGGEGLHTMVELLEALKTANPDFTQVRDLGYRENGELRFTAPAPLVTDVDQKMPGIAWDLLPMERYRAHNWHCLGHLERSPYAAVYTTLGCPYKCSFCCIQAPFKSGEAALGLKVTSNSYRFWSPKRVADDLEMLRQKYGVRNVKFADEMFVLNRRHVEGICDELIARRLDLNIWAYARVDTVKEGMLDKLRSAGFTWLAFGIEAANPRVRADVQKGFDQDDIFRTLSQVRAAGIHVIGNYIFGLPEDDLETMQQTLDLALEVNCEFANFYCAMAYPGSPLYREAVAKGWPLPKTWNGYSQHAVDSLPLPTRYLSAAQVLRFRDAAFQTYYTNPSYLEMVERTFGWPTVEHIREMTGHKLERKYG
ncbi:MAG TPA: radical SAM protein [Gemmataceae bacterium]|nr:radical SAM protein [Gemmataceae bacterium]